MALAMPRKADAICEMLVEVFSFHITHNTTEIIPNKIYTSE
jgi:hypothetical protein